MKSKNTFFERDGYMVGVTKKGVEFFFDNEDFQEISQYTWCSGMIKGNHYINTRMIKDGRKSTVRLHVFVLGRSYGVVDHINNNCLDNRKTNLRRCSHAENMRNRSKRKPGTSMYKGVHYCRRYQRWKAQIQVGGKKIALGGFDKEIDAAVAYNKAAVLFFGTYAHLNTFEVLPSGRT